jgi:hypothetical protein
MVDFKETNQKQREEFIDYRVAFMKSNSDEEWSRQQNVLINSLMQSAKHYPFSPKEYLKMKEEVKEEMSKQSQ